ncbi:MAG: hypothetical protein LC117_08750 [Bacteroidia bacterium]|nr:hypothetical protein [Bacteroidia bacterium]MCZ2278001.1 hypothetical protein [Bacteroidia bacterium]
MKTRLLIIVVTLFFLSACRKGPGEGGTSSIQGYLHVKDYNASQVILFGEYPGVDEWVYIIYGNDISYGDRVRTNYEGKFEFNYLRNGDYRVYAYSDDTTLAGTRAVVKNVTITKKNEVVTIDSLIIIK